MPLSVCKKDLETKMEEKDYQISVGQLMRVALKQWWVILISAVLVAIVAFTYVNLFVTPKYTSSAKVGIHATNATEYQNIITGNFMAKEGEDILVSNVTLSRAAEKLNAYFKALPGGNPYRQSEYKWQDIKSMLKTSITQDTRYFEVKIVSTSPTEAQIVCQAVIDSFCEVLEDREKTGDIIDYPVEPTGPSSPNKMLAVVLGLLIGAIVSFAVLLIIYFSKDALDGEDWIIETYRDKIPMLAVIPDAHTSGKSYKKGYSRYGY